MIEVFMPRRRSLSIRACSVVLSCFSAISIAHAQGAKQTVLGTPIASADRDHVKERSTWFLRGRVVPQKPSAELRRQAYEKKMRLRSQRNSSSDEMSSQRSSFGGSLPSSTAGLWTPLGPMPVASDASGTGLQDYHQVSGRATAVAIDPADASGNTVFIGGAQGGVWKSTNAANSSASGVIWTAVADDQATLSVGSIAIQPGNSDPAKTVILVGTGEANNSADSYFGLGILRSNDAGNTWTLIPTANNGALSFSGLGGTRMAFSTANTVVSAMGTTSEGTVDGSVTANTTRGLYTSTDAGLTWTYNALFDPGNQATDATSSTSVVYNATAGLFFAAIRYHGFYSSPDGTHWTRLTNQPGGGVLNATACPPQSTSNNQACPIYRAEIAVVPGIPGRNEMYVWFISLDSSGNPVSEGLWQSLSGGTAWTQIVDGGITNCGDPNGCGVEQAYYNFALLALPNGSATDLYAGAINLYKCSINVSNPTCNTWGFMNLTHAYGCIPIASPAHVHPDQHALAFMIPSAGTDSGNALLYFANDGGIYRALNGFSGLNTGSCGGTNQFDDLNQNLGSMTQLVSFSQHPTDPNTLLGGAQDNGSPATSSATTSTVWINVNGGDGGFNAIDPGVPTNWFVTNPDIPPGGLNLLECSSGVNCRQGDFNVVVGSGDVGGDDGAFYFPYLLDPQSSSALLVGTCRVWRGPRLGVAFTLLSPNFDTLGSGTCAGSEINLVRALATGGPRDGNGSRVIYATTDGFGPQTGTSPSGGHVWVTTNATAGTPAFAEVTQNINPDQFPVSSVVIDTSDSTGDTAFVTVMGFTGGAGHVWKTIDAGITWTDFTGTASSALPDSPVNAVVVDASAHIVYVGTDVGVFRSGTGAASWAEVGPNSSGGQAGFLPNVAVTALGIFNSGGQKLLRASTYGRGIWQFNLAADFQMAISNSPKTIFPTQAAIFNGTVTALNGFANSIRLSCAGGASSPPSLCTPSPLVLTPTTNTPFTITAGGIVGDYDFNVQGVGSDTNSTTHQVGLTLHVIDFGLTTPSPATVTAAPGTTSSPVNFQVTAAGSFNQSVTVSCSVNIPSGGCNLTPGVTVNPTSSSPVNMMASIVVPLGTGGGSYTASIQARTSGAPSPLNTSFTVNVSTTADFVLTEPLPFPTVNAGSTTTRGSITVSAINLFAGTVNLTCSLVSGSGSCSVNPTSVNSFPATVSVTVNAMTLVAGSYQLSVHGNAGAITHTLVAPFNVGDYQLSGVQSLKIAPGAQGTANLLITSTTFYSGRVNANCDVTSVPGAICTLTPANPITVGAGISVPVVATINVPNNAALGTYNINVTAQDSTGTPSHSLPITLTVSQDFGITSSTPSRTVVPGQTSAPYILTIQPVGTSFNGAVTLSCPSGLPSGAQCDFTPNPIIPGSSAVGVAMTISTSPTSSVGNYTVVVTGSSGSLSHSLTESLTISGDDFTLAVTQPPGNIDAGAQATATLTITPGPSHSFQVNATCDASALSGAICTLTPPNPIAVNSGIPVNLTAIINLPNSAAPGTYLIGVNVQEVGGPIMQSHFPLTVIQDFSINSATPSQMVAAGQTTGAYQLTVSPVPTGSSFTGAITLSCSSGLPVGTQCNFSPSTPVVPGSTSAAVVMSISTSTTTSVGTYTISVIGASGSISHSTTVSLIVVSSGSFQLKAILPFPSSVDAGSKQSAKVSLTPNYSGSVNASCAAGAPGFQCSVAPANPVAVSAGVAVTLTLALNIPNTAALNPSNLYNVNLTVTDSSGQPSRTLQLPLTVIQDFSVNAATHSQMVAPGQTTGAYQLTVAPAPTSSSFSGAVTLSCSSGLPAGAQCIFSPSTPITMTASGSAAVVMSISTPTTARLQRPGNRSPIFLAMWMALPGIVVVCGSFGSVSRRQRGPLGAIAVLFLLSLTSCGGGTSVASGGGGGRQPTKYTVTISGISGSLSHITTVDLLVSH